MPIRINLLEEEQKQKLARKRDPMMVASRLAVLCVLAVLVYSLILYTRQRSMKEQLDALRSEWSLREKKFAKVDSEIKDLKKTAAKADTLKSYVNNRFLWAPQLEMYKDVIPGTVQITRLVGHREVVTPAPSANPKAPASVPTEMVRVTLEGIAEGSRPELVVQDFLTRLKSDEKLSRFVDDVRLVSLNKGGGVMPGRVDGDSSVSEKINARFVIEVQYKQRPARQA